MNQFLDKLLGCCNMFWFITICWCQLFKIVRQEVSFLEYCQGYSCNVHICFSLIWDSIGNHEHVLESLSLLGHYFLHGPAESWCLNVHKSKIIVINMLIYVAVYTSKYPWKFSFFANQPLCTRKTRVITDCDTLFPALSQEIRIYVPV